MKRVVYLITALMIICALMCPVLADVIPEDCLYPRYYDEVGLLTEYEADDVCARLDEVSERQNCDVAIAIVQSLEGWSVEERADDFYDYNGYGMGDGDDGILLLLAWDEGEWCITTYNYGERAFNEYGREYIGGIVQEYLYDGDFYSAFVVYEQLCDDLLTRAAQGHPYDAGDAARDAAEADARAKEAERAYKIESRRGIGPVIRSLFFGAIIALIATSIKRSAHKSVKRQSGAASYTVEGSLAMAEESDKFLYSKTQMHRRESSSSTRSGSGGMHSSSHVSSSGRSHGTTSGKFR